MHHLLIRVANDKFRLGISCELFVVLLIMSQNERDCEKQGFSYMDGVPVKISEQYKPPKKYNLPVGFMQKLPTDTVTEEYDFQLEQSVLEKICIWRRIRMASIEDRHRRIETEEQAIQEQAEKLKEISVESPSCMGIVFEDNNAKETLNSTSVADSPKNAIPENHQLCGISGDKVVEYKEETDANTQNSVVTLYGQMIPSQSYQYSSSNILTPTPYGSFLNSKKDLVPSSFNLSDFEADTSSPFDNMELKTINDMEELAYVLQPMSNSQNVKEMPSNNTLMQFSYYNPNMIHQAHQRNAQVSTSLASLQSNSGEILSKNISQINGITSYSLYGTVPRNQTQSVNHIKNTEVSNGPYGLFEGIGYHYPIDSMQSSALLKENARDCCIGHTWDPKTTVVESTTSSEGLTQEYPTNKGNAFVLGRSSLISSVPTKTVDNNNMYALPFSFHFASSNQTSHSNDDRLVSMEKGEGRSLRSSKSVPDIMKELETELNKQPFYQISQRLGCNTPPLNEQSKETKEFEKWKPWPILDSPDNPLRTASSNVTSSAASSVASKSDIENARTLTSLPNPFAELSSSAQILVQHISEMGFSLPRVSRACQLFGEDDKKIVEYLLQVQSLEEKSYPGDLVEQSLISNNYDETESINYMKLVAQLMDLGFTENQVIQALKINENDGEKALDYLVS